MKFRVPASIFLFLGIFSSISLAEVRLAKSREVLAEVLESVPPGTTIQLASGEWPDLDITIHATGTSDAPVILEAQHPGQAIITGRSSIVLDGEFITIRGLYFKETIRAHGAESLINFRNAEKKESSNCRVSNVFFEDCNPDDPMENYPWIRMYGHHNRVDHCRFSGQEHKGRAIQVRVYEPDPGHRIDHNHFLDRPPGIESNGYEIIQIGLSGDSMKPGNVLVDHNIFSRCDGETEIISSKSCGNKIRNNLFLECSGSVTLRHGNGGEVRNNAFVGNGKPYSGGVRVVGTDNIIEGNYFSGLTGRTGGIIVLYCGIPDSPLNGYFSADRAMVKNNIFYRNTGNSIFLNGGFGQRNRILLPSDVQISGNVFGRPATGGVVAIAGVLSDVVYTNNSYVKGVELGRNEQEGFVPGDVKFIANKTGLLVPQLAGDESPTDKPIVEVPEIPEPGEVGPEWMRALPDLLLINGNRLSTLMGQPARELLDEAESILDKQCIYSVTTNDRIPPSGDKHDYYSTGPYWWPNPDTPDGLPYIQIDGKFNPERDLVSDRAPLLGMIHDVEAMALAYAISGDKRYADWGAVLLKSWFLDEETRMNPNLNHAQAIPGVNNGRGRGIIDTHPFCELVDAIRILENSPALGLEESIRLKAWFLEYVQWLLNSDNGKVEQAALNNHGTAFDLQVAALLWFTDQKDRLVKYLRETTLPRIKGQIRPDGSQPLELARTRTWSYCTENLEHFFKLGLIGRKVGVDLFTYTSASGASIKGALDYLLPYVCDSANWPHPQKTKWQNGFIRSVLSIASGIYTEKGYALNLDCLEAGESLYPLLLNPGD